MLNKILLSILLMAAVSHAAVEELLPQLTSSDLKVQTQARLDLLSLCSAASAPDAPDGERKAVSLEICEILGDKQPIIEVVQPLLRNLERISDEEAVVTLAKYLSHKNGPVRDDARRALVANPSPKAGQALAAHLKMRKTRDPKEIAGLITALGERRDPGASNLIAAYVSNKDEQIFIASVKALGRLNEDAGITALAVQRKKEKGLRRIQIDAALFSTERTIVFEKLYVAGESDEARAVALLGLLLAGKTELAAPAMASGDPREQSVVVEAALQGGDPKVLGVVASELQSLSPAVQAQVLNVIARKGDASLAPAVQPLLESDDLMIQDGASRALARVGTADSVKLLLANGRPAATRSLGMLQADGVDAILEEAAANASDSGTRISAINALAGRGRTDLIPTFFQFGLDEDRGVATAAVKAISQLGDVSNIEALTELMIKQEKSPVSRDALQAIIAISRTASDASAAVDILVKHLDGVSPRSQSNILKALAQTGREEALEPLKKACLSSDAQLQKTAVKELGGWPSLNGVPTMLEVATNAETSDTNHVIMMRGISRLYAGAGKREITKADVQQAMDACRRDDERSALQGTYDKLKK